MLRIADITVFLVDDDFAIPQDISLHMAEEFTTDKNNDDRGILIWC